MLNVLESLTDANTPIRKAAIEKVIARHPVTGDDVWFNQAHLMHRSAYAPGVIERMFPDAADDELPFNVFFADGSCTERVIRIAFFTTLSTCA